MSDWLLCTYIFIYVSNDLTARTIGEKVNSNDPRYKS
jgi:hypothetical protein